MDYSSPFNPAAIAARQRLLRNYGAMPPPSTDQQGGSFQSPIDPTSMADYQNGMTPPQGFSLPMPSAGNPQASSGPPPTQPSNASLSAAYQNNMPPPSGSSPSMPPPPGYTPPMPSAGGPTTPMGPTTDYSNQMPIPAPYGNSTNPMAPDNPLAPNNIGPQQDPYTPVNPNDPTNKKLPGDFDNPGSQSQWNSMGKTDDFGSFFNKKTSSDALTAFGAAMLKAPTFNQGLGDAASAVNTVDQQNRMPSPAQIAQAKLKAQMNAYMWGMRPRNSFTQMSQGLWTKDGIWNEVVNKTTGESEWQGPNGEHQPNAPVGGIPFQATGMTQSVAAGSKDETAGFEKSQAAQLQLPALDRELSLIKGGQSGVGMGALADLTRTIVNTTGVSFNGTQPKDMNELTKMLASGLLDTAQGQKGLGPLSDGERALIERASSTTGSDPQAVIDLLNVQKQRLQRVTAMQNSWDSEKAQNNLTAASYRAFVDKFTNNWDQKYPFNYNSSSPQQTTGTPTNQPSSSSTTTPQPSGDPALRKKYGLE